jgi:hypothetical protein
MIGEKNFGLIKGYLMLIQEFHNFHLMDLPSQSLTTLGVTLPPSFHSLLLESYD